MTDISILNVNHVMGSFILDTKISRNIKPDAIYEINKISMKYNKVLLS